jgi:MFS family permease
MTRFKKDEHIHDMHADKKLQPSKSVSSEASVWITLTILGSTILITMYGETMLLPAMRDIIRDFDIPYNTSSWILTAYLISGAVATPIAGKLSDIYGRKKMVMIILIVYIVGICTGGISTNISFLLAARIIQGIGISMFPIAFGIIRDQLPKDKLAIGVGIFSSMFAAGSVVGLAVGGTIIQNLGWHATFLSIVPVAMILRVIINKSIDGNDSKSAEVVEKEGTFVQADHNARYNRAPSLNRNLDVKGAISLAVVIASFLLTLTYIGNSSGNMVSTNTIPTIVVSLAFISIGSLALFIIIERRAASPLMELSLMTHRILLPANIIILIFGMTMFMVYQTTPILVRSPYPFGFGGDAVATAMIQLPFMVVFLIFAPFSGFIVSKIGNLKPTIAGTIIMTAGFFMLFMFHSTGSMVAMNLAIVAAGISLMQVGAFNITMEYTLSQLSGVSLGMSVVLVLIGSSIGPAIAGIYMQTHQEIAKGISTGVGSFPSPVAYNLIFLTAALISTISIVLAIILKRRIAQSITAALKRCKQENSDSERD